MALRAVIDHPKFTRLKSILKLNRACTLGYLEAMWHFCGRFTQQGNIGKYPIAEIEAWIEWPGESGALIDALVKSKWIDEDPVHGLLVHDWYKHADAATKLSLKRGGLEFIVPTVSQQCSDSVATVLGLPGAGAGAGSGNLKEKKGTVTETDKAVSVAPESRYLPVEKQFSLTSRPVLRCDVSENEEWTWPLEIFDNTQPFSDMPCYLGWTERQLREECKNVPCRFDLYCWRIETERVRPGQTEGYIPLKGDIGGDE